MKISSISEEDKIKWWQGRWFEEDFIELAMTKAYGDLQRTITGFASNKNKDSIKNEVRSYIKERIKKLLCSNEISQTYFDNWHKETCLELINVFENKHQTFTIGQAQKWINMTFKYLHLLEHNDIEKVYEYCHIPIDRYILDATEYKMSQVWSKLTEYEEYLQYQKWFREQYEDDIPLDVEFDLWIKEAKKSRYK